MNTQPKFEVLSRSSQQVIASRCAVAQTALTRLVGLLSHKTLESGHSLLIEPCNQVHTLFMQFPIDVVFLNKENSVVAISELVPWRISRVHLKARKVLELPLGTCRSVSLNVGDRLEFRPCSS